MATKKTPIARLLNYQSPKKAEKIFTKLIDEKGFPEDGTTCICLTGTKKCGSGKFALWSGDGYNYMRNNGIAWDHNPDMFGIFDAAKKFDTLHSREDLDPKLLCLNKL